MTNEFNPTATSLKHPHDLATQTSTTWLKQKFELFQRRSKTRAAQMLARRAFENLLILDEDLLKDIGVTRDEVIWASRLPLDVSAAQKLKEIADRRREALKRPADPRYRL